MKKEVSSKVLKLSAIVLAKNEETMIANCLDSLSFCSEIIVIDNASTDKTAEIATRIGAKVFEFNFTDFSKARNYGLSKAAGEWILYIDADERITPELKKNILDSIEDSKFGSYALLRQDVYFGDIIWPTKEKIQRLFRKDAIKGWQGEIHESPIMVGKSGELSGQLLHYTHRDLSSMLEKTINWSDTEASLRLSANHPKVTWWRFPRVMITGFIRSYIKQKGYKAGTGGLVESLYQAFSMFVTYAKLWEMQRTLKK